MPFLSHTAAYALRTTLFLAARGGEPATGAEIAAALKLPRNYLSKTLHRLAREGILASARGPGGGFRLARPAARIRLAEIVRLFDPMGEGALCLLGRPVCSDRQPCAAHARWKHVSARVAAFWSDSSVADLLAARRGRHGPPVA